MGNEYKYLLCRLVLIILYKGAVRVGSHSKSIADRISSGLKVWIFLTNTRQGGIITEVVNIVMDGLHEMEVDVVELHGAIGGGFCVGGMKEELGRLSVYLADQVDATDQCDDEKGRGIPGRVDSFIKDKAQGEDGEDQ